jgi:outer membrane lipoprotein-sorting protein
LYSDNFFIVGERRATGIIIRSSDLRMLVLNLTLAAKNTRKAFIVATIIFAAISMGGCFAAKTPKEIPVTSAVETATKSQLIEEANRFSKIVSISAKMKVTFEDTTYSNIGKSDKYHYANGEVIVQRPSNIYLKIEAPVVKVDIAQMTSNGKNFRVAVLEDGGSGKFKKFVTGSNEADYSLLQKAVSDMDTSGNDKEQAGKKNASAFSNLRPQHFTDALMIRPLEVGSDQFFYVQSEIFQEEGDPTSKKSASVARLNTNYYLLEELKKKDNDLVLTRRFWFNRIGRISLARQQIFAEDGTLESDITYGNVGKFTETGAYILPLKMDIIRPKEKYKMSLEYERPETVVIGDEWKADIFTLKNRWGLTEVDLDKKLEEVKKSGTQIVAGDKQ